MKSPEKKTEAELAGQKKPKMNKENANLIKKHSHPDGLDKWNDRLDHNLENEHEGNEAADEEARNYSEQYGNGDQSDETKAT